MAIEHLFVLMLENRSFDHMLGFSKIAGTDAKTGEPTTIHALSGTESNSWNGSNYPVTEGADLTMPTDPSHEFPFIVEQLCGAGATYPSGGPYPPIDNSGFVASYMASGGQNPAEIMKCYAPDQLPVLMALASEFVVCDHWHASLPGPTWPNRMFVHAASSGGLDHTPTIPQIVDWETVDGFPLPHGTIFDQLESSGISRRLYSGDDFPMVAALKGIHLDDIRHYSLFESDLQQPSYPYSYVFIEPSYDILNNYRSGTSQHPLGDVTYGEALIKQAYEAIRNSQYWETSLLIITWDEHGGFYDHKHPGAAPAPNDGAPTTYNEYGFTFTQYGPRVPAVVVSPLIPGNLIDHRIYDHASIPATLESLFGLTPMTARDQAARAVNTLCTLQTPRTDAPTTLPNPAASPNPAPVLTAPSPNLSTASITAPDQSANAGNLPAVVHSAMRQDLAVSPAGARPAILARVRDLQTRRDALHYLAEVQQKIRGAKAQTAGQ